MEGSKHTLDEALNYEIAVAGVVENDWSDLFDVNIALDDTEKITVSNISGVFDQAALQGLLSRLYSFGYPLLSVNIINRRNI